MTIHTDVLIIGAGPVGLFQVFELGLLDIKAHVVDAMPRIGGQCVELYPDKPIYDIPAVPVCSAKQLVDRLREQIDPFGATFHLGQTVIHLKRNVTGGFDVRTSQGTEFDTRAVIVAGGVGAFQPRRLRIRGTEPFEGCSVHYQVRDRRKFHDKQVVILGGGDSALDWALALYGEATSVVVVHRSDTFRAAPASVARMRALCEQMQMQHLQGNVTALNGADGRLQSLDVLCPDHVSRRVDAEQVIVCFGLLPKLGPIADWGLALNRNQIVVDTETFETNVAGIFAVGDINTYPGKKKLILSGFHETALASFGVHRYLYPDTKVNLQYTTTSPKLHARLGLKEAV